MEVNILRAQILIIIAIIFLLMLVFYLVKKKFIKEKYSIFWIFILFIVLLLGIFRSLFDELAHFLGIDYAPSLLIIIVSFVFILFLIYFTVILSKLSEKIKILAQEIAILKSKINKMDDKDKP